MQSLLYLTNLLGWQLLQLLCLCKEYGSEMFYSFYKPDEFNLNINLTEACDGFCTQDYNQTFGEQAMNNLSRATNWTQNEDYRKLASIACFECNNGMFK